MEVVMYFYIYILAGLKAASERLREKYKIDLINCLIEQPLSSTESGSQYFGREELYIDLIVLPSVDVDEKWTNSDRETLVKHKFIRKEGVGKAVDQLLTPDDDTVFIRGVAGIGKSTLIDMFTFKWAKKEIKSLDIDFVFKFTCREMNDISDEIKNLDELFSHQFPEVFNMVNLQDLAEKSDKILIIVDGLDELRDVYLMDISCFQKKQDSFLKVVFDLINNKSKNKFEKHKTFVCGRPKSCEFFKEKLLKTCKTKTIEVYGFNNENIERYIFKFFAKNAAKAKEVLNGINSSSNLGMMASVPVFLWVICHVYSENLLMAEFDTDTELYLYTCLIFLRNHLQGLTQHSSTNLFDLVHDKTTIQVVYSLMVLSVKTYMQNQVIFTEKEIKKLKCPVHLEQTGFIVKYSRCNIEESKYQFRHLILQEFFCAMYICITKNVSPFLTNRELSSCLPTIHGVHRIIEEANNKLYTDFYCALEMCHASNSSLISRLIDFRKEKEFRNFIESSEFNNIELPNSMINGNILMINSSDTHCLEFLNIFKESKKCLTPLKIDKVKLCLRAWKDQRYVIEMLLNFLGINNNKIEILPFSSNDPIITQDMVEILQRGHAENEISLSISIRAANRYAQGDQKLRLTCFDHTISIVYFINHVDENDEKYPKLPLKLLDITKHLFIKVEMEFERNISEIKDYALKNNKKVRLEITPYTVDAVDGLYSGKRTIEYFPKEFETELSTEQQHVNEASARLGCYF